MRSLLIILQLVGLVFIFGQVPDSTNLPQKTVTPPKEIEKKIQKVYLKNEEEIQIVKEILSSNKEAFNEVKKVEKEIEILKSQVDKKIDKLIQLKSKEKSNSRIVYVENYKGSNEDNLNLQNLKLDSTCLIFKRDGFLNKKKCVEWEYFKTLDSNKIKIK